MAPKRPSGGGPAVPSDLPPEYAEVYRAAFERAYAEAQATWSSAPVPAGEDQHDVVDGEVVEESTDSPTDARQAWAFEPPADADRTEPEAPEWEFEPPQEELTPEWSFEAPGDAEPDAHGNEPNATTDADEEPDPAARTDAAASYGDHEVEPDHEVHGDSWVVPGFAASEPSTSPVTPGPAGDRTPPWVALAVLVVIAFVVLLIFLVLIF